MVKRKWSGAMINTMEINGYRALIQYDPEIDMFRGEFIDLNGGPDFYATDIQGLRKEGETSLKVFLEMCQEDGVEPRKAYSGKFNLRISPSLHAEIAAKATAAGKSLNQWIADMLDQSVRTH
jgi:predicted HicB family RNase H-like nuclease